MVLDVTGCTSVMVLDVAGCTSVMVLDVAGCTSVMVLDVAGCPSPSLFGRRTFLAICLFSVEEWGTRWRSG
jgi:hypothetical protein